MDRLGDTALIGGERSDATDHCLAGITRLSSEVKDASGYLPAYDQRTYAEAIKALQERLEETKKTFAPKPKFSFKSTHKSPSALSLSDAAEMAEQKRRTIPGYLSPGSQTSPSSSFVNTPGDTGTPPNDTSSLHQNRLSGDKDDDDDQDEAHLSIMGGQGRPSLSTTATSVSISNQSNTHIILPSSALHAQTPCSLRRLSNVVLDLSVPSAVARPFASLTINSAHSSLLVCGSVTGPAHITGLKKTILVINCQQFRMHQCQDVDVYLRVSSRPIIEDCRGIRFAPFPKFYTDLLASSSTSANASNPSELPNLWNQVDDFKWIKADPSPNWSILPSSDLVPDETWREVVPGGPGWTVATILKAVGLGTS
ncbi:hypothetical protein B0A52_00550 [Exophiala mesophila]|uniref:C-CAP/cofactor C-like domain-containing protein n=1 Tax=Exophiala mesophila TaxID=212818 RepID=A0A438NHJ5_EXOME|nr:hypothetical protein B0A52_00550 [Exophiala mesophila]